MAYSPPKAKSRGGQHVHVPPKRASVQHNCSAWQEETWNFRNYRGPRVIPGREPNRTYKNARVRARKALTDAFWAAYHEYDPRTVAHMWAKLQEALPDCFSKTKVWAMMDDRAEALAATRR